jgi:hypothetical protein
MKWSRPKARCGWIPALALGSLPFLLSGCAQRQPITKPSIEFSIIPQAEEGGPDTRAPIAGRVIGAHPGQQIVLFAKAGTWWVQPTTEEPFTAIHPDSTWTNSTHLGSEYAALLVEPGYRPPPTIEVLPSEGGDVVAVKSVPGERLAQAGPSTLQFSGYEWHIRNFASNRGGRRNNYKLANAWTDDDGFLHLRIANSAGQWSCAEGQAVTQFGLRIIPLCGARRFTA